MPSSNVAFDDQSTKTQSYGFSTNAGSTLTNFEVVENDFVGNSTAAANFRTTPTSGRVSGNLGYNPVASAAVTVGFQD